MSQLPRKMFDCFGNEIINKNNLNLYKEEFCLLKKEIARISLLENNYRYRVNNKELIPQEERDNYYISCKVLKEEILSLIIKVLGQDKVSYNTLINCYEYICDLLE